MASDITLSSSTRTNLLALQRTTRLMDRTNERLATGRKVNSALDDALAFFKARNLNDRASDLASVKDGIAEGINVIKAATDGLDSIESVLKQMKALASSARSATDSLSRSKLASQFNELRSQVDNLTEDASYNGINLIKASADTLTVKFNELTGTAENELALVGQDSTVSTLSVNAAVASSAGWAASAGYTGTLDTAIEEIDSALTTIRSTAQTMATNSSMLNIRKDFTDTLINTLEGGAAELVNADINEESANLTSLQTRQQLGVISIGVAQQSEQAVLRLFR